MIMFRYCISPEDGIFGGKYRLMRICFENPCASILFYLFFSFLFFFFFFESLAYKFLFFILFLYFQRSE